MGRADTVANGAHPVARDILNLASIVVAIIGAVITVWVVGFFMRSRQTA